MLVKEAEKIKEILKTLNLDNKSVVLNLGSQNHKYLQNNPHILHNIIKPVLSTGASLVNFDLRPGKGVDIYGDIFDEKVYEELKCLHCNVIILSNILEHVYNIGSFVLRVEGLLSSGGTIIFSGPYKYPVHLDPIDNLFRPKPDDLIEIFSQCRIISSSIVKDINYFQKITLNFSTFINEVTRILTPFYKFNKWHSIVVPKWKWLLKSFEVTVALIEKK